MRTRLVAEGMAGDRKHGEVVEVQVVPGQAGEVVSRQPLEVCARLVRAAGLAEQHGKGGAPAGVRREPVHKPPERRFQLGQPSLLPAEPNQHDHVVDADDRVVGPLTDGQCFGGQPFRLVELASQQLLARPEQGTCQEKCSCCSSRAARS